MENNEIEEKITKNNNKIKIIWIIIILLIIWAWLTKAGFISNFTKSELLCPGNNENIVRDDKPVIYLYPKEKQKIKVQLDFKWKIIADYPEYDKEIKGWEVEAYPNGRIINLKDWKEYSYLFWEWISSEKIDWNLEEWFIVKWKDSRDFLSDKLEYLGLTPKEYNEFIVFWYPKMMNNKYNLIHFATKKYTDSAPLKITPKPDSILRVFMVMKSLDEKIEIKEQKLEKFERKGFVVVEWWGSKLK